MSNYDPSAVGVPYTRVSRLFITWPDNNGTPVANIEQALAVKLADGTVRQIQTLTTINVPLDLKNNGDVTFPLINPETGGPLGGDTSLNQVFLHVLAAVRSVQLAMNGE